MFIENTERKTWPDHYDTKYQGIPFVVLDIPKIEMDDNFLSVWNENAIPVVRLKPDARYTWTKEEAAEKEASGERFHNEYTQPNWNGFSIQESGNVDIRFARQLVDGKSVFPKFYEQLFDYLPIKETRQILFWSNQRRIGLHRDLREQYPFPSSLRIMISDENPEPTFWLQPRPENSIGAGSEKIEFDPITARFVDTRNTESNTFVYNNRDWLHGAKKDPAYNKILCSLTITWDYTRLDKLLDKSIERYGNNR